MNKNDIFIIHGTDYKDMTIRLLHEAGLAEEIGDREKHIALKPTFWEPCALRTEQPPIRSWSAES